MTKVVNFFKATVLGGFVFLVPIIAMVYVLGKAIVLSRKFAEPVAGYLPVNNVLGIALADILGLTAIMLLCFAAGLLARNSLASRAVREAETQFLWKLPGYSMVKGLSESFGGDQAKTTLKPVIASLDDTAQLGFEVDRLSDGRVVVYVPSAPDVWSGSVLLLTPDRIESLPITVAAAVQNLRALGQGMSHMLERPT